MKQDDPGRKLDDLDES